MWIIKPFEIKAPDGSPSGKWRLCAESDEEGGFHVCCEHEHPTKIDAINCPEAQTRAREIAGTVDVETFKNDKNEKVDLLLEKALKLCHHIEAIPAGEEQTRASIAGADLHKSLKEHFE